MEVGTEAEISLLTSSNSASSDCAERSALLVATAGGGATLCRRSNCKGNSAVRNIAAAATQYAGTRESEVERRSGRIHRGLCRSSSSA